MKVSNNKIGGPQGKIDSAKSAKTESAQGLRKGLESSGPGAVRSSDAKVDVSERAQMMQRAKEIAGQPSQVDEAKVARLQKMIDEGSYKVDSEKVAGNLIDEHMLMPD